MTQASRLIHHVVSERGIMPDTPWDGCARCMKEWKEVRTNTVVGDRWIRLFTWHIMWHVLGAWQDFSQSDRSPLIVWRFTHIMSFSRSSQVPWSIGTGKLLPFRSALGESSGRLGVSKKKSSLCVAGQLPEPGRNSQHTPAIIYTDAVMKTHKYYVYVSNNWVLAFLSLLG